VACAVASMRWMKSDENGKVVSSEIESVLFAFCTLKRVLCISHPSKQITSNNNRFPTSSGLSFFIHDPATTIIITSNPLHRPLFSTHPPSTLSSSRKIGTYQVVLGMREAKFFRSTFSDGREGGLGVFEMEAGEGGL